MELATPENGSKTNRLDRVEAYRFGLMDLCMRDTGKKIRHMVREG